MAKAGRKPEQGRSQAAAEHAAAERARYQSLSPAAKRDVVQNRDREAQQAADNRRHQKDNAKRNAKQRDQNTKNWERDAPKRKARAAARMQTPQKCAKCGSTKVQAHHSDYSKPKDVTWLCSQHHGEMHQTTGSSPT